MFALHRIWLAALPVLLLCTLGVPSAFAQRVGQIASARPQDIEVVRGGVPLEPLQFAGLELRAWDRVLAHGGAPVDILLDQTRLQLAPGTEVLFSRPAPDAQLEIQLLIGRVVVNQAGPPRLLGTPEALLRTSAGRFLLVRTQRESRIVVQAGSFDLLRPGVRSLTAGEDLSLPASSGALSLFADYRDADVALQGALDAAAVWADLGERWTRADRQRRPVRLDQGMPVPPSLADDMERLRAAVRRVDALAPAAESLLAGSDPDLRGPLRDPRLIEADRAEAHYLISLFQRAARNATPSN